MVVLNSVVSMRLDSPVESRERNAETWRIYMDEMDAKDGDGDVDIGGIMGKQGAKKVSRETS